MKHYIVMNGSAGCLPDNVEVHETKEDAIDSAVVLFDDYEWNGELPALRSELEHSGIFYFPPGYGADYVEIIEEDCIGIENGCEYCDEKLVNPISYKQLDIDFPADEFLYEENI